MVRSEFGIPLHYNLSISFIHSTIMSEIFSPWFGSIMIYLREEEGRQIWKIEERNCMGKEEDDCSREVRIPVFRCVHISLLDTCSQLAVTKHSLIFIVLVISFRLNKISGSTSPQPSPSPPPTSIPISPPLHLSFTTSTNELLPVIPYPILPQSRELRINFSTV